MATIGFHVNQSTDMQTYCQLADALERQLVVGKYIWHHKQRSAGMHVTGYTASCTWLYQQQNVADLTSLVPETCTLA